MPKLNPYKLKVKDPYGATLVFHINPAELYGRDDVNWAICDTQDNEIGIYCPTKKSVKKYLSKKGKVEDI